MPNRFATFRQRLTRRLVDTDAPEIPDDDTPAPVRLIVGLGNPDDGYRDTRHNVGAWCIRRLAERHGARLERRDRVFAATAEIDGVQVHLARPRSYVNESGPPVAAELRRLGLRRSQLLVIYDELDLPLGQLRIREQGGHGGHNGIRSIVGAVGGNDFSRIRVGIDRPYGDGKPIRDPESIAGWVLAVPPADQRAQLDEAVERAADAAEVAVLEGVDRAMSRLNPS